MNNKLVFIIIIIVIFVSIFTVFATVAKANNLFSANKQNIIIILKNDADINVAKDKILKIPQIKITKITYRDKEWSKMVNKMDLPNMENPFKNEFTVKFKRNSNINEILNKIKEMDFVENVKYDSDTKLKE